MQKQQEWKLLKEFKLTFPNCDKGIDLLCQSTIFVNGTRYRDIILALSKTHYKLTKTFLTEVTRNQVKVNDKNWRIRFGRLYSSLNDAKPKEKKKAENIAHLIKKENTGKNKDKEEEVEFDNDHIPEPDESSSSVVEDGEEESSEEESSDFVL